MELIKFPIRKNIIILALGAESAGVFAIYKNNSVFVSENFGDLLDENNFLKYKNAVLAYLKKEKIKPDVILTDLHPLYKTTIFGEELALRLGSGQAYKKYPILCKKNTRAVKVQHHISHIFSAVADYLLLPVTSYQLPVNFIGIAMDGTGYGLDGNTWGGEIFRMQFPIFNFQFPNKPQIQNFKCQSASTVNLPKKQEFKIKRIGSLEEQVMIGGDLAVREPARMIMAILAKIPNPKSPRRSRSATLRGKQFPNKSQITNSKNQKEFIYKFVKKFYTRNEFEALYNQMEQNFNCQKTTSTGRILDAVSVLLGFAGNERKYKHEAVKLLEENSTIPYNDCDLRFKIYDLRIILDTTYLFEYLIKNIHKDKKRLAATAQLYIAKGVYEMIKKLETKDYGLQTIFAAGGLSNNKIISSYLEKQGVYLSKKIPRGDEGISFGQVIYYLTNSRH